ncbi:hypothetical protein Tco_0366454 [Tanacetum coccineum]
MAWVERNFNTRLKYQLGQSSIVEDIVISNKDVELDSFWNDDLFQQDTVVDLQQNLTMIDEEVVEREEILGDESEHGGLVDGDESDFDNENSDFFAEKEFATRKLVTEKVMVLAVESRGAIQVTRNCYKADDNGLSSIVCPPKILCYRAKKQRHHSEDPAGYRAARRELLGFNGAFIKAPYTGQILTAGGIDSNNEVYPLAYAIGILQAISELFPSAEDRFYKEMYNYKVEPVSGDAFWPKYRIPSILLPPHYHVTIGRPMKKRRVAKGVKSEKILKSMDDIPAYKLSKLDRARVNSGTVDQFLHSSTIRGHRSQANAWLWCMTWSSTKELLSPLENPERVLRSRMKLFDNPSLVELNPPEDDQLSEIEEHIEEEVTEIMAETMEQYMSKTREDYGSGVTRPTINQDTPFELKGQFLKELCDNVFSGSEHEDENEHIEKVLEIVDLFHIPKLTQDQIMLRAFPVSLTGAASRWLRNQPLGSITTWEVLKTKFLNKYYLPARTAKKMEEINNFQQEPDESLFRAWERFKELLMKCPQHYLTDMQEPSKKWLNTPRTGTMEHFQEPEKEEGKTLEEAYYTQFGAPYQPGGQYRAAGPGFYQRNNRNSSYPARRETMEESLAKFMAESAKRHEENSNIIKEIRPFTDAAIRNQGASINTLKLQIGQMTDLSEIRRMEHGLYAVSGSQHRFMFPETVPFPRRLHNYCCDGLKEVHGENILDAYDDILPQKEKDPGSFTLPCLINNICFDKALVDLGASVSVMPFSTYTNLGLGDLSHTRMTIELADRTIKQPKGIAANVLVRIGKFIFPIDFVILDIPEDNDIPLILGRPFLSSAHVNIDVYKRKVTLRVGEEKLVFKSVKPASSIIKRVFMDE